MGIARAQMNVTSTCVSAVEYTVHVYSTVQYCERDIFERNLAIYPIYYTTMLRKERRPSLRVIEIQQVEEEQSQSRKR